MSDWPVFEEHDSADIQGIVVSGYGAKPLSRAIFIDFGTASDVDLREWLARITPCVTYANKKADVSDVNAALLQVALSADAMRRLRPDVFGASLDGFDQCFAEGMTEPLRRKSLGDADPGAVVDEKLRWRGTVPADDPLAGDAPETAQALLLLYAGSMAELNAHDLALPLPPGAKRLKSLDLFLQPRKFGHAQTDKSDLTFREHFGFADSVSQPRPHPRPEKDDHNTVKIGDFLLGQQNAYGERVPGPLITDGVRGHTHLRQWGKPAGLRAFGINGTYLVARQLHQDVAGFWAAMKREAEQLALQSGEAIDAMWLAERVVGRGVDGDSSRCGKPLPRVAGKPANDFGYARPLEVDFGCPVGSHVRRAHPRDGQLPSGRSAADRRELIRTVNGHRILRRGRSFGAPVKPFDEPDEVERGLLFLAINADIARQFEFIMRTWMLNPAFAALDRETDPLLGKASPFSIPHRPVRLKAQVERYVRLAGGDYYFLPSKSALRFLAS